VTPAALRPVSRRELIVRLRACGFDGPFAGTKHQFMVRGERTVRIPNPHGSDVGVALLRELLRQAGLAVSEWLAS
jgi:predicted RNA binding protein YcfA (HicA-like mRNA interferase family)